MVLVKHSAPLAQSAWAMENLKSMLICVLTAVPALVSALPELLLRLNKIAGQAGADLKSVAHIQRKKGTAVYTGFPFSFVFFPKLNFLLLFLRKSSSIFL